MQYRVGLAHAVPLRTAADLKAHALIKTNSLTVLLVNIHFTDMQLREGIMNKLLTHALSPRGIVYKQHLQRIGVYTEKSYRLSRVIQKQVSIYLWKKRLRQERPDMLKIFLR